MTLVLRYVDNERLVCVGDTRITLSDDGRVIGHEDERVSKSFFVCGYTVSYSGLAVLNRFNCVTLTTREWISASLKEAQSDDKDICQTLEDMASALSGNAIIAPEFRGSTIDIGLMGLSPAPEGFDPDAGGQFVFDENFSFDDDGNRRWAVVVIGHLHNIGYSGTGQEFTGFAEHYVPSPGKTYHAWGVEMPESTVAWLDERIVADTSTIDIVNAFVGAIRQTADAVGDESIGRNATVSVVPLQVLADAMGSGSFALSERDDEKLPEGYIAHAFVNEVVEGAVMVPKEQVKFIETDQQPSAGGFIG